jgi:hypothetical protein
VKLWLALFERWDLPAMQLAEPLLAGVLIVGAGTLAWRFRRAHAGSPQFALMLGVAPAVALVLAPAGGGLTYNQVLLIPGVLLIARQRHVLRQLGFIGRCALATIVVVGLWGAITAAGLAMVTTLASGLASDGAAVPLISGLLLPLCLISALAVLAAKETSSTSRSAK